MNGIENRAQIESEERMRVPSELYYIDEEDVQTATHLPQFCPETILFLDVKTTAHFQILI